MAIRIEFLISPVLYEKCDFLSAYRLANSPMFSWGQSGKGELGLGGTETETFRLPYLNKHFQNTRIQDLSCGYNHTIAILDNGSAVSFGTNEFGQLGQQESERKPGLVRSLTELRCVRMAACGARHSLFLTTNSEVYACGDNSMGQLGLGDRKQRNIPKQVQRLDKEQVIQIVCGKFHSLALTRSSLIYSWGSNQQGQLGTGSLDASCVCPNPITTLQSIFIAAVSSGASHSFALSSSGSVFAWGRNTFGQLGLGDTIDRRTPFLVESIQNKFVTSVEGGEEHTVFLTREGAVFSFGCGVYGQLGHDSKSNQLTPKQIFELMDCVVLQVACGRVHTLITEQKQAGVRAFGLNSNGQIGIPDQTPSSQVHAPVQVCDQVLAQDPDYQETAQGLWRKSHRVYAGGDQSFLTVFPSGDGHMLDMRKRYYVMPSFLTSGYLKSILDSIPLKTNQSDVLASVNEIMKVFSSPALLSGSFLSQDPSRTSLIQEDTLPGLDMNGYCCTLKHPQLSKDQLIPPICNHICNLLASLPTPLSHPESLRVFLLVPPLLDLTEASVSSALLPSYLQTLLYLEEQYQAILRIWYSRIDKRYFLQLLTLVVSFIQQLIKKRSIDEIVQKQVVMTMTVLGYFHSFDLSQIPRQAFYIRDLPKYIDFFEAYDRFVNKYDQFSFCNYPFVLDEVAKTNLLSISNIHQMKTEIQHSRSVRPRLPNNFHFTIVVSRGNIIQDTLNVLTVPKIEESIRKPLIIKFKGELGQDEGGVKKEFFMILVRDVLSPSYGMFKPDDESNLLWFLGYSFENPLLFELLGTICGLAIYNDVIINLPFPLALYKKLLGVKVDLSDLVELHPSLGNSLKSLLAYTEDDFEEVFGLTFEITQERYGDLATINLIEEGASQPVTMKTRKLYVEKYIDFTLNKSIEEQFNAFARGFFAVCKSPIIHMFQPEELRLVICGNPEYDFSELEQHTTYGGGYYKHHTTIVIFWETIHSFTNELKKKFLSFLTGSDRVPISGLASLKFKIDNVYGGVNCERLPVAHTCFNILALPPYLDKTVMRTKLLQAINFSEGFLLA